MKRILLVSLTNTYEQAFPQTAGQYEYKSRQRLWNTPHLGLLTVAGKLKGHFDLDFVDLNYGPVPDGAYDYVFFSPATAQAPEAYRLARRFRSAGSLVAMGGAHVTALPQEALQYADMVFFGESEDTLDEFIRGSRRRVFRAPRRPDLASCAVPDYALAKRYPYTSIPVQLSRGCPHQCSFCLSSKVYGRRVRRKPLTRVVEELTAVRSLYPRPFVFFTDDNFLFDRQYSVAVLDILRGMKLQWYAFTDISIASRPELLDRLYESGCRKLLIGFESLDEQNLGYINRSGYKRSRLDSYAEAIEAIQSRRIGVVGSFVLGLPYDTPASFDRLGSFLLDTRIYGTNITAATPFPGTDFYREKLAEAPLCRDWSKYDGFTLLYDLPGMTRAQFGAGLARLMERLNSPERIRSVLSYFKDLM